MVAALLAGFVAWRWRRLELERKAGLVLVILALAVYATGVLSALPDPKVLIGDIASALGPWTYVLVGVMAFLETGAFVGLVAPGETVVIAGGVIAGQGEIDLLPLIGLVWICAVLGDTTSFFIGRRLGRSFLEEHGPRVKITHERLEQVEGYFDRHGGKTILVGRFIGLVRALAPFIAGASGLSYRRFIPFSVVGTGLWATAFCVLGYIFWRSFDRVAHIAGQAVFGFGLTVGVIVGVVVAYRRRAEIREWFRAHESHPLVRPLVVAARWLHKLVLRPVVTLVGPEVRFLQDWLSVKLVTAMAVAGGGAYVFVLYVVTLSGSSALTPFDLELFDVGRELRTQLGVDVAKVMTSLGSFASVSLLLAVAVVVDRAAQAGVGRRRAAHPRLRDRLPGGGPDEGGDGPAPPAGPLVDTSELRVAERPRGLLHDLGGGGGGAHARARGARARRRSSPARCCSPRRSGSPASTCAPTTGRTWRAGGRSARRSSVSWPRSR